MEYSSTIGFDLYNNDVYIDTVCSEKIAAMFYEHKSEFNRVMDFGGGIFGISVAEVLEKFPNASKLRTFLGKDNITKKESVELYQAFVAAHSDRAYLI